MKLKVIVHEAEEGGYWAEVPAIPGCATEGDTFEELLQNLYEAVDDCLSAELEEPGADLQQLTSGPSDDQHPSWGNNPQHKQAAYPAALIPSSRTAR